MRKFLYSILLSLSGITCISWQTDRALKGKVLNRKNGAAVAFASIDLKKGKKPVVADSAGNFLLSFSNEIETQLTITAAGFFPQQLAVLPADTFLLIYLEESVSHLDEVIVTGVGNATKIKSTPVAIATVSAKEIARHPNTNAIDALSRTIPGLQTITTGPNVSKPSIRGLGYNRVLTLFDGIRQEGQQWADEHGIEADQYHIARAEVIKGPASIAYGSDAVAGVINLIPFVPVKKQEKITGDALMEYFTNNNMMAASVGLHQFKKDFFWAGRASFKEAKDYRNQYDGRVFNTGFKEWNISTLAGWKKSWWQSYFTFTAYNNQQEIPDGSRDSLTRKFTRQVSEGLNDDITNRPVVSQKELNSYRIDPLHQHIRHYRFYNKTTIKWGSNQINTAISFTQNSRQEYNHPTIPQQAGLYIVLNTGQFTASWNKTLPNDLRITSGINTMFQTNRSKNGTDFPIPDYNMTDAGAFAMLEKEWQHFSVSGGVRYDLRHIQWKNFYTATNPGTGFDYHIQNRMDTAGANLAFSQYSKSFSGLTTSLGFTCTVNSHVFLKANFARGYRSPNITEIGANGLDPGAHIYYIGNRSFVPEFNWQQDIGFFLNFPGFEFGLELFNNQVSNYIFLEKLLDANGQPVEIVPGNNSYGYQQGSARLYGFDMNMSYRPKNMRWLKLQSMISSVTGLHKDEKLLNLHGESAKYLPLISPMRILNAITIELPGISEYVQSPYLRLETDIYGKQQKFYAVQHTETATPAYQLYNVSLGVELGHKEKRNIAAISLQAENMLDRTYQYHLNRLKYFEYYTSSTNGRTGIFNMGRNFCLKTTFYF